MSRVDNNNLGWQITSLLSLFYIASSSLHSEHPLPFQLPAPRNVIAMSEDLDRHLSLMAGDNLTRPFVLFGGAYIELCKVRGDIVLLFCTQALIVRDHAACRAASKAVPVDVWHVLVPSILILCLRPEVGCIWRPELLFMC
jgi:hypothetical protein